VRQFSAKEEEGIVRDLGLETCWIDEGCPNLYLLDL